MQERMLQSRGIAYRINAHVPHRKTLVFIHGLSGSLSAWYPYEPLLEQHFNIVTFDLRGHGLSLHPAASEYAMVHFVEDLHVLLAELQIASCIVVSHSFGTLVAMEFARTYPHMIERAIFLAPPYQVSRLTTAHLMRLLSKALILLPFRISRPARTDYSSFYPTPDYSPRRIATDIRNMGLHSYLWCMQTLFARNYDQDWQSLSMPLLIVHGKHDTIVPYTHAEALCHHLPNAHLQSVEGNHILVLNNVEEVAEQIQNFVAQ